MVTINTSAAPPPKSADTETFRRVVIEEDDGSEDEVQPTTPAAATHCNVNKLTGGPAVHLQRTMGATPAEAASGSGDSNGSSSRGNFRRIVIQDEDSSEGESHTPVAPATTAFAAPPPEQGASELTPQPLPAGVVTAGLCFDDMD